MEFKFESYCDDGTNIWIVPYQNLGLYRLDKKTGTLELEKKFPKEYQSGYSFYGIVFYERKIFLIPCREEEMLIYDLSTKQWNSFPLPDIKTANEINNKGRFYSGILYLHYIYLFGYSTSVILRFDIETSKFEQISDVMKEHMVPINNKSDGFFHASYIRLNNKIYYPFMNANAVLVFDLDTNKSEIFRVGEEENRFISIAFDGKSFWLIPRAEGNIVQWNAETEEQLFFNQYPSGFEKGLFSLYQSIYFDGYIWVLRHMGNMNLKIDASTGEMTEFHLPYDEEEIPGCRYPVINMENNKIRVHPGEHYEWIEFDPKTNEINKYSFQKSDMCKALEMKYYFQKRQKNGCVIEGHNDKLIDLSNICLFDGEEYKLQTQDADCGAKIHKVVKNSLK